MSKSKILVSCPKEIPPLLSAELSALGFPILGEHPAGVMTEGTLADCMKLNLWIRTGHRVHLLVREFKARNGDELYNEMMEIPWEDHIREDGYISIASSVKNPTIRDGRFANLKCKDAICDRIRKVHGRRPDAGSDTSGVVVFLYWRNDRCAIYFDTSGDPMSKRGYRRISGRAPMQETLAASVILTTGWNGGGHFVNPMCGSGTLAIEAALIAQNRAPGLTRGRFSFMSLKGFDRAAWEVLRGEAESKVRGQGECRIVASDLSPEAVEAARKNAAAAGVESAIEFVACDFAATEVPKGGGIVVFNPGYGERMGDTQSLVPVYRQIGDFLKRSCRGYKGYVFTGNRQLFNKVSLKASREWPFWNSNIECRLLEYDLY